MVQRLLDGMSQLFIGTAVFWFVSQFAEGNFPFPVEDQMRQNKVADRFCGCEVIY